jgi:dihydrofolate reductase
MRRIVAWLVSSLDGVVESPERWGGPYLTGEMNAELSAGIPATGTVLLGRRTYQEFAGYWPHQGGDVPFADYLNNSPKHVVSATLEEPLEWKHATLVGGDPAEGIAELKRQPGGDILVLGSLTLVRSLLRQGLLDELTLNICPIVLGSGRRLFDETTAQLRLELVQSTTSGTGVLRAGYRPADGG